MKILTLIFSAMLAATTAVSAREPYGSRPICNDNTQLEGYKIRSVKIKGKWVPQKLISRVNELLPANSEYDPGSVAKAQELVGDEFDLMEIDIRKSLVATTYVFTQVCRVPNANDAKFVDVTIIPYYVQVDITSPGRNILPIAQINTPSFSVGIPPALAALSPIVSGFTDRSYGPSLQLKTHTNLFKSFGNHDGSQLNALPPLSLDLGYRKSFTNANYNLDTAISYFGPILTLRPSYYITLGYENSVEPLGSSTNWSEAGLIDFGLYQRKRDGLFQSYLIGIKGRLVSEAIENPSNPQTNNSPYEQAVQAHLLGDLRIKRGAGRIGVWGDFGYPSQSDAYQRAAVQAGYATEVGKGHNTIGIELLTSAGYAWGNPPQYGTYYAGVQSNDFLYAPFLDKRIQKFPAGPLLRSFGQTQAGLNQKNGLTLGATSYWGVSITTFIPIPGWSRPLIPDIQVGSDLSLGQAIKGQLNSGKIVLIRNLKKEGYSPEAARDEAARLMDQSIIPAVNNLVDSVNIISVRPFVALDIAQLGSSISTEGFLRSTYVGVGAGLQATLVGTTLEMGYMQSVAPSSSTSDGNFFLRFVLKDLF